jgi:hypothetical protein
VNRRCGQDVRAGRSGQTCGFFRRTSGQRLGQPIPFEFDWPLVPFSPTRIWLPMTIPACSPVTSLKRRLVGTPFQMPPSSVSRFADDEPDLQPPRDLSPSQRVNSLSIRKAF